MCVYDGNIAPKKDQTRGIEPTISWEYVADPSSEFGDVLDPGSVLRWAISVICMMTTPRLKKGCTGMPQTNAFHIHLLKWVLSSIFLNGHVTQWGVGIL